MERICAPTPKRNNVTNALRTISRNYLQNIVNRGWHRGCLKSLEHENQNGSNAHGSKKNSIHDFKIVLLFAPSQREVSVRQSRSEEHTSELQSLRHLVCRLL